MSVNDVFVAAPPGAVWAVLSDARTYAQWVVGSSEVRHVDGKWPEPGSTFHHTQGAFGVGLKDTTTVLGVDYGTRIELCVRTRPLVVARVDLELGPSGQGTRVVMRERPVAGVFGRLHNPVFDLALKVRNAESLRRLAKLARQRAPHGAEPPGGA